MKKVAFRHDQQPGTGILLVNLGTPDAPTAPALRRYLGEFLADPRVIEIPRIVWRPLLHGVILRTYPKKSAAKYAAIWTDQGSPLLTITQQQAKALSQRFEAAAYRNVHVAIGMRYGNPSIKTGLEKLRGEGVTRLLVLPLYPQYSAATTASAFDALAAVLRGWRWLPELRFISHYHDHPLYIKALAESLQRGWAQDKQAEKLLFSFHGLPKRNLSLGDPYHCECHKTARLVAERLQLDESRWAVAFQSRFGRAEWLQPYADKLLQQWAAAGVKSVDVICPGFAADCVETLEEMAIENREVFLAAGGERYRYLPALNDNPVHIDALQSIINENAAGWAEFTADTGQPPPTGDYELRRRRALAMGAVA